MGSGSGRRTRKDAVRNRERILDAAVMVLSAQPDASAVEIAAAADVSTATLYRHFPSRDAITDALRDEARTNGRALLEQILRAPADRTRGRSVAEIVEQLVHVGVTSEPRFGQLMASDAAHGDEVAQDFIPLGEALVQHGQRSGELRTDISAALLTRHLVAVVLCNLRAVAAGVSTAEEAVRATRIIVSAMRAQDSLNP